jgi:hypothetical protein
VVAVAGVNCTVAVRFVTEVVASGAEAVVVSVTVSVLEGAVTVRVAVPALAGAVVVAGVVLAAVLVPVALAPSPAPMASSTTSRGRPRMRRDVTLRLSPAVCGPATVWPRLFTGCQHHRREHGDGELDSLSAPAGGPPRLALLFELSLLDPGRGVRLLDELLAT